MKTYIIVILAIIVISCSSGEKKCTITGEIIGRKTNALLLFKASRFPLYEAEIPISNSSFNYSFKFRQPEVYLLIFKDEFQKGLIRETPFFAENGKINFSIHSDNDSKGYTVKGHKLNDAYIDYYRMLKEKFYDETMKYTDSINAMYKNGTVFSKEFQAIQDALKNTKETSARNQLLAEQRYLKSTGLMYNPKAKKYVQMQDSIAKQQKLWERNYIDNNTSLLSLYLFMNNIREAASSSGWRAVDQTYINKIESNLARFTAEFQDHPYCQIVKNAVDGFTNIHDGGKMIDFTATNVKGDSTCLSSIIKGRKLTLLHFWSTWYAPSIKICKDLIPLYNDYKNKGFEIVGITQGFGKTDELTNFINKENYPWTNLIDKDCKAGAWEKYNLSYQSGGTFLVDSSGKIVGVNLTADKVKEKLVAMLK